MIVLFQNYDSNYTFSGRARKGRALDFSAIMVIDLERVAKPENATVDDTTRSKVKATAIMFDCRRIYDIDVMIDFQVWRQPLTSDGMLSLTEFNNRARIAPICNQRFDLQWDERTQLDFFDFVFWLEPVYQCIHDKAKKMKICRFYSTWFIYNFKII